MGEQFQDHAGPARSACRALAAVVLALAGGLSHGQVAGSTGPATPDSQVHEIAAGPRGDPRDPLEGINREVDALNYRVDQAALRPVARAYERAVPSLVRRGVSNFFANLGDVWSAANSVFQLKPVDAAQNTMRFLVNTGFGLGGVLDIATDAGIERHKEDFGATLAHWGVPAGPYMVLPLIGPTTLRDAVALPVDWMGYPLARVSPVGDRSALVAAGAVDLRARLLPVDGALDQAFDRYTMMRDAYLQHREAQVHPGDTAGGAAEDPLAVNGAVPAEGPQ